MVATGTGHEVQGGGHKPGLTVNGLLAAIAVSLSELWDRPVTVPPDLANQSVNKTLQGSPQEIARALGLGLPNKA